MEDEYVVSSSADDRGRPCVLRARHVTKRYEKRSWLGGATSTVCALSDVSLTIREGSRVSLTGQSGGGKSTLARCLAGLEVPDSGEICFEGRNWSTLRPHELRRSRRAVQLIFQDSDTALNPWFTAEQILIEPLAISGSTSRKRRERAFALLHEMGLPVELSNRRPHQLSGGQRQRLAIGRALAADPKIMILDEALSGLDLPIRAEILDLLFRLQAARSLTFLFISHDLRLAACIGDEIAVMEQGRIVECGELKAVLGNPQHPHTRSLLRAVPALPSECRKDV